MPFAENFKKYLLLSKMTQVELSEEIGIPQSLISEYISGKKNPSAENALKIATFFKVPLDTLMGRNLGVLDLLDQTPRKKLSTSRNSIAELVKICEDLKEKDLQTIINLARRLQKK
jgi:transcriptional regulator with XRE-family HTH domain